MSELDPRFQIDRRRRWMVSENYLASDGGWATAFRDPTDEEWASLAAAKSQRAALDVETLRKAWEKHQTVANLRSFHGDCDPSCSGDIASRYAALMAANPVPTPAEALRCGDHPKFGGRPLGLGCGQSIEGHDALYRCAQCDTAFHKECIRQHFDWPEAGGGPLPHALDAGLAALASQPAADLDVEQLARAFVMVGMELDGLTPEEGHAMVERLAAAYRDAKRSKE